MNPLTGEMTVIRLNKFATVDDIGPVDLIAACHILDANG